MIEVVEEYCATYLYDAWQVKQDGRDRLIVYSDDWIHTDKMAADLTKYEKVGTEVTDGGYQIHIQL
jgi:hypothetical protein